ncbi:hypothetical protein SAMN05444673_0935 [Bacillus sp. OV166]|uniref:hypothetical protein n=1 Tax=Bacillus sp. OV166 TaxID=1882763 RepID=UPI000A2AD459|nr:hypothetical protein [Bacillus sp. OV166]SMQ64075.1 hypothetical protein SAMN05444673_0935 [Bacillus sp. OV166]
MQMFLTVVVITYALRIKLNGTSADISKLNREWTKQSLVDFFFIGYDGFWILVQYFRIWHFGLVKMKNTYDAVMVLGWSGFILCFHPNVHHFYLS